MKMHYNSSVMLIVLLGLASVVGVTVETAVTSAVSAHTENKLNLEAHEATKL